MKYSILSFFALCPLFFLFSPLSRLIRRVLTILINHPVFVVGNSFLRVVVHSFLCGDMENVSLSGFILQ